jgi:hypothetical protein
VVGRLYGSGSGCAPLSACAGLTYTVPSGSGLGGYAFTPHNFPAGFVTCTTSANSGTCVNSTGVTAATGTTPVNLNVSVADAADQATPTNTITSSSVAVTVNAAFALTDNYSGAFPDAVVHRDYGISGDTCASSLACAPIKFTATGGLPTGTGAYSFPTTTPASFPTGFSCSANSPATVYTCSASPVSLAVTPGSFSPSVTVTDSANSATPTGSKTDTGSLHVDSQIALGVNLGSTWPDGVTGRGYGTGGLIAATYTASNGLPGAYTFSPTGSNPATFPTGFDCSPSSPTLTCTASPTISGAAASYSPHVAVTDTANATTPAATTTTDPSSTLTSTLVVDPEIVIANQNLATPTCGVGASLPCALPNGQKNQPYSVLFTCQAPLGTGTCGGTGDPDNAHAEYTWSATSNNITGTSFTTTMPVSNPTGDAVFSGTATKLSNWGVTIGVADNGSTTTPSCTVAATCPSGTFSANILPSAAFVDATNNAIDVFDTSAGATSVTQLGSTISPSGGFAPNYAASSINGTDVFVADPGVHQLYIIDSASQTVSAIVTNSKGLANGAGDTHAVAVGPQVVPTTGVSPDDVYAFVANAHADNVQIVDANPTSANFGTTTGTGGPITFTGGPYTGTGATDLKVAPTFFVSSARVTHGYVVRPGGNEVCVFDAEPSSGTFKSKLTAAHSPNSDNCISLGATATYGTPAFIDVSPDGLYAFVTQTNGTTLAGLNIIDTNPNSGTFETLLTTIDLASLTPSCPNPAGVRVSPDGQTVWVACQDISHQLVPFETALVNVRQFAKGTPIATAASTDAPVGFAFLPDSSFGLATLSGANEILPFTTTAGTAVATTGVTAPFGIDHVPNPVLHIVTSTLPAATHGVAYQSSIAANGPNKYFAFTDLTAGPNNLAGLGLTLSSDGQVTSTTATSIVTTGTFSFTIQVTDQSKPVNNVVVKTVTLTIN